MPLATLFNNALTIGQVSKERKMAIFTAIFRNGLRSFQSIYRPVTLNSIGFKMLESIICRYAMALPEQNNLLNDSQHGFSNGRSSAIQLIKMIDVYVNC